MALLIALFEAPFGSEIETLDSRFKADRVMLAQTNQVSAIQCHVH